MLIEKDYKVIEKATLYDLRRLIKNSDVNTSTIIKLCELLNCQPGDIMEYVDSEGFIRMVPTLEGAKKMQEFQSKDEE